ncbi:DUF1622 domain-containing protein [candidate division KSB1 bacterium]|nr:DUF1622 domain-containing protein [candidate division KSB1 bacterium]
MQIDAYKDIIATAGYAVESAGVLAIIGGFILSTARFLRFPRRLSTKLAYIDFRRNLGRSLLLGLEFLIAGDMIRTVVVSATLQNILVLALIIIIRTFLGITLHLEVEGRWPWQEAAEKENNSE